MGDPTKWAVHGFVGDLVVWRSDRGYLATEGEHPSSERGYPNLRTLLGLKGENPDDFIHVDVAPRTFVPMRPSSARILYRLASPAHIEAAEPAAAETKDPSNGEKTPQA